MANTAKDVLDEVVSAAVCRDFAALDRAQTLLFNMITKLELDAERYQWLEDNATVCDGFQQVEIYFRKRYDSDIEEDLTKAIDAVRKEKKETPST